MKARPRCTCEANATEWTYGPFLGRPTHNRKGRRATGPVAYRNIVLAASRVFLFSSSTKAVPYFGAGEATSFWKRGSFLSGSNMGSSRSSAGVSGPAGKAPAYGIESSFCKAAMARSGSPICAATRARISIGMGPVTASFSIGSAAMARSDRANAAALSPKAHIGKREISNEEIIVRLFFEKRFQFAARLAPTCLGGGMVAGDFLRPA